MPVVTGIYFPICLKVQATEIKCGNCNPSSISQVVASSTVCVYDPNIPGVSTNRSPIVNSTKGVTILSPFVYDG